MKRRGESLVSRQPGGRSGPPPPVKHQYRPASKEDRARGHICSHCGAIGAHLTSDCPDSIFVGMPQACRDMLREKSIMDAATEQPRPLGMLDNATLIQALRRNPGIPVSCCACCALPENALWCKNCSCVACELCTGPGPGFSQVCPQCQCTKETNLVVVPALRDAVHGWLIMAVAYHDAQHPFRAQKVIEAVAAASGTGHDTTDAASISDTLLP